MLRACQIRRTILSERCLAGLAGLVDRFMSRQNLSYPATETGEWGGASEPEQVSVTGTIGCPEAGKRCLCLSHIGNYVCPRMLSVFRIVRKPGVSDGCRCINVVNVPMA